MSRVVFVGNVPYNMGEDQLIEVFKSVGQVIGFRLVFDRDTGKPKGYGFCEFADHETAMSAVRNLNNQDCGGRPLRIDLADSDPFLEGKTTSRGELLDGGDDRGQYDDNFHQQISDMDEPLAALPPGLPLAGKNILDAITQALAAITPSQLIEVLAQMKAFVITHPEQARALLVAHPQLAYALFQALLLNKIVDPAILQQMLNATTSSTGGPPPLSSQPAHYPPYPQHTSMPPHVATPPQPASYPPYGAQQPPPAQAAYYGAPPPSASAPPHIPPQPAPIEADVMQLLSLTREQLNSLPEQDRLAIEAIRSQYMART